MLEYKSERATYLTGKNFVDFGEYDWGDVDKEGTLLFFDDHIGTDRIRQAKASGFKHIIFEDNYSGQGGMNCHPEFYKTRKALHYSPKASFAKDGPDRLFLEHNLKIYYEFPPIAKNTDYKQRCLWNDISSITKDPLLEDSECIGKYAAFKKDAFSYTWISYLRLK